MKTIHIIFDDDEKKLIDETQALIKKRKGLKVYSQHDLILDAVKSLRGGSK